MKPSLKKIRHRYTYKALDKNPTMAICSYLAFAQFGKKLMGLKMVPEAYCPDYKIFGLNEAKFKKNNRRTLKAK